MLRSCARYKQHLDLCHKCRPVIKEHAIQFLSSQKRGLYQSTNLRSKRGRVVTKIVDNVLGSITAITSESDPRDWALGDTERSTSAKRLQTYKAELQGCLRDQGTKGLQDTKAVILQRDRILAKTNLTWFPDDVADLYFRVCFINGFYRDFLDTALSFYGLREAVSRIQISIESLRGQFDIEQRLPEFAMESVALGFDHVAEEVLFDLGYHDTAKWMQRAQFDYRISKSYDKRERLLNLMPSLLESPGSLSLPGSNLIPLSDFSVRSVQRALLASGEQEAARKFLSFHGFYQGGEHEGDGSGNPESRGPSTLNRVNSDHSEPLPEQPNSQSANPKPFVNSDEAQLSAYLDRAETVSIEKLESLISNWSKREIQSVKVQKGLYELMARTLFYTKNSDDVFELAHAFSRTELINSGDKIRLVLLSTQKLVSDVDRGSGRTDFLDYLRQALLLLLQNGVLRAELDVVIDRILFLLLRTQQYSAITKLLCYFKNNTEMVIRKATIRKAVITLTKYEQHEFAAHLVRDFAADSFSQKFWATYLRKLARMNPYRALLMRWYMEHHLVQPYAFVYAQLSLGVAESDAPMDLRRNIVEMLIRKMVFLRYPLNKSMLAAVIRTTLSPERPLSDMEQWACLEDRIKSMASSVTAQKVLSQIRDWYPALDNRTVCPRAWSVTQQHQKLNRMLKHLAPDRDDTTSVFNDAGSYDKHYRASTCRGR